MGGSYGVEGFGTGLGELCDEVITGMKEWRLEHPKAAFAEIEKEVDLRLAKLRGRILQDTALASCAKDWSGNQRGERPVCPDCGQELAPSGQRERRLQTLGGEEVTLEREYGICPACGGKFFPLAEELELLPGSLTPGLAELLVGLGSWMPFAQGQGLLVDWMKLNSLSEATVRRHTESCGGGLRGHAGGGG